MIPPSELPGLLADLKQHLNISTDKQDVELLDKLEAGYELAEAVAGRAFYPGTATELVANLPLLAHHPVTDVSAVTHLGTSYLGSVSVTTAGVVTGAFTGTSVTYTYGQTEPTPAQREGILLIAAHLWDTQRGAVPSPLQDDDAGPAAGFGYAVPNRARDLLRPPRAVSGIA